MSEAEQLLESLRQAVADFDSLVQRKAQEIAAPRIAAAEAEAESARRIGQQRVEDLSGEFQRQLKALSQQLSRQWVACRYLPGPIRAQIIRDNDMRHPWGEPPESFMTRIERAAAEAGVAPFFDSHLAPFYGHSTDQTHLTPTKTSSRQGSTTNG